MTTGVDIAKGLVLEQLKKMKAKKANGNFDSSDEDVLDDLEKEYLVLCKINTDPLFMSITSSDYDSFFEKMKYMSIEPMTSSEAKIFKELKTITKLLVCKVDYDRKIKDNLEGIFKDIIKESTSDHPKHDEYIEEWATHMAKETMRGINKGVEF